MPQGSEDGLRDRLGLEAVPRPVLLRFGHLRQGVGGVYWLGGSLIAVVACRSAINLLCTPVGTLNSCLLINKAKRQSILIPLNHRRKIVSQSI